MHYDGQSWKRVLSSGTSETLRGVWGTGPGDVFAVGASDTIVHYDGQSWKRVPSSDTLENLAGVWGSGPGAVFAVGWSGTIVHYDGVSWLRFNSTTDESFQGIWGHAGTSFMVGDRGTIFRHTRTGATP
ncbi:uncharacterized protein SOCE26_062100 [Sorangium cellulosum]|uniref:Glucosyltransferase-I n=1 Tax=Sorangium cellulosum TaxID=56 RepID=A0A2L0EZJ7_SORCE|nr:hypothetical protein [Sorangium cellulosum]AUX44742.1 uncharacterized protein SOCE26_062100 [Sorangium cellulosum]